MKIQFLHFLGILMVAMLMRTKKHAQEAGPLPLILFNLPSTILHESMHFIVALITAGRPSGFSIFPDRQLYVRADGSEFYLWTLGSVKFYPGVGSAFPTAMAPLGMLPIAFILYIKWFSWFDVSYSSTFLLYFLIFILLSGAMPSRTDLKVAFSNPVSLVVTLSVTALIIGTAGLLVQFVPTVKMLFYKFMIFMYS